MVISLDNIAGIVPHLSTYADVLRLLGSGFLVELVEPRQPKNRLIPGKRVLRFQDTKIMVVFIDPGGELPLEAKVTVVGVEEGSPLRTSDGLYIGMSFAEAEKVILRGYNVRKKPSFGGVEIVSADNKSPNYLWLSEQDDKVMFIGLYQRETD